MERGVVGCAYSDDSAADDADVWSESGGRGCHGVFADCPEHALSSRQTKRHQDEQVAFFLPMSSFVIKADSREERLRKHQFPFLAPITP